MLCVVYQVRVIKSLLAGPKQQEASVGTESLYPVSHQGAFHAARQYLCQHLASLPRFCKVAQIEYAINFICKNICKYINLKKIQA
jgi:hypothetical protein